MKKQLSERNGESCRLFIETERRNKNGSIYLSREDKGQTVYKFNLIDRMNRMGNAVRICKNYTEIYVFDKLYTEPQKVAQNKDLTANQVLADNLCSVINELLTKPDIKIINTSVDYNKNIFIIKYNYKDKERTAVQPLK